MLRLLPLLARSGHRSGPCSHAFSLLGSLQAGDGEVPMAHCQPALQSAAACSTSGRPGATTWNACHAVQYSSFVQLPDYALTLYNIRDNPGATKQRIRVGRGDSARRGNYSGRGMKGMKARGRSHILYDGGQLGLLKFPVMRERPSFEVLYNQLSLNRIIEFIQLGLLDSSQIITMKDLQDSGCISDEIKYGVVLYGKGLGGVGFPLHIQVTACDPATKSVIEASGGSVTRVYYTKEGLKALLKPQSFTSVGLPLPALPPGWHPKHDGRFDAVGQLPPTTTLAQPSAAGRPTVTAS